MMVGSASQTVAPLFHCKFRLPNNRARTLQPPVGPKHCVTIHSHLWLPNDRAIIPQSPVGPRDRASSSQLPVGFNTVA